MALINMVDWTPQGRETIYAWKFPENNLSTMTQLVVRESQEALLFSKGQLIGKFGPGKHTLNTENLPLLRSLYGIPFGGKNPFTAEIWFVNKTTPFNIDWRTDNFSVHDPDYNTFLPLVAEGRYGLKIDDAEKFLINIVGTRTTYTQHDLTDQFLGEYQTKTKSAIVQFIQRNKVGFKSIAGYLDDLSTYLQTNMSQFWSQLGLVFTQFYITGIDIDQSTENGRRIAEAIAQQSSMSITGHTWQQEQMFGVANNAMDSMGNGQGGLLGGIMAIGMMNGMGNGGGVGSGMMQAGYAGPSFGPQNNTHQNTDGQVVAPKMIYCASCGKRYPNTSQFCPNCGHKYNPCPKCGTDNEDNARRCIGCGTQLNAGGSLCPHCHAPLAPGAAFCGNCGKQIISSDNCTRCGSPIPAGAKFCPRCGQKRD